jgi:hypothetical protein
VFRFVNFKTALVCFSKNAIFCPRIDTNLYKSFIRG